VSIPGISSVGGIANVEAAAGEVSATINGSPSLIVMSPVGSDNWRVSSTTLPEGAGGGPRRQIVLAGSTGWVIDVNRGVLGGAQLVDGEWAAWNPPCSASYSAVLAASDPRHLVALCDAGRTPTSGDMDLYLSSDGGTKFVLASASVPEGANTLFASPSRKEFVIARGHALLGSFDAGWTWRIVSHLPTMDVWSQLAFVTPTQGVAIASNGDLFETVDGARHWSRVSFHSQSE
jgi:hypothetical protein